MKSREHQAIVAAIIAEAKEKATVKPEEKKLVDELNELGFDFKSIWDLVYTRVPYPEAIPVLIKHLKIGYNVGITEGIVRSLICKEAKGIANQELLNLYNSTPNTRENSSLTWVIGTAFNTIIKKEDVEPILQIVQDKSNGTSRQMFVAALGKFKSEKTVDMLIELLADQDVILHALWGLGRLKSTKAKDKIIALINTTVPKRDGRKTAIRNEAKKALLKILKEEEKVALKLIQEKEKTTKE